MDKNKEKTNKAIKLRIDFLIVCSLSLGTVICAIYFFVTSFFYNYEDLVSFRLNTDYEKIGDIIVGILNTDNIPTNIISDKNNSNKKLTQSQERFLFSMLKENLVTSIIVVDNETNKVLFPNYLNNSEKLEKNNILSIQKILKTNRVPIYKKNKEFSVYLLPIDDSVMLNDYFDLQMNCIFLCALILCFVISWALSDRIILPINSIKSAADKYAEGNLEYRIQPTRYLELNSLINSYHIMASNLQILHNSLEKKVELRTLELEKAIGELKNTQSVMVHSEKMKSLGGLVAGITHEINNPVNFIYGNLVHLSNYTNDLISIIEQYSKNDNELSKENIDEAIRLKNEIDYEFLREDLPALIKSCREGTERTKNIIQDLKNFSRMDANVISMVDLPKEIDTTLNILTNKLKNKITVHKDYAEGLPLIEGMGGQLNQVFMNILDNAAYAIKEKGDIFIRIKYDDKYVLLEFEDNGVGMDDETLKKIFEPFYTTKPVGQGTGLGMSISYKVIKVHSGTIIVDSLEGQGTLFKIVLPIKYTPNQEALAR